ncbi:MAG: thiol-disulfide oxidoreductase, partial [Novosphingobium sp. 16-62-11]
LSGAAAFAAMWRAIPRLRWLGQLARIWPLSVMLEGLYRLFLIFRPQLQRLFK